MTSVSLIRFLELGCSSLPTERGGEREGRREREAVREGERERERGEGEGLRK